MPYPSKLTPSQSALLVVDVQEKLMPKIRGADALIRNMAFLIDAAKLAGVWATGTEQYPKGLGATVSELAGRLPARPEKLSFSCCGVPGLVEGYQKDGKSQIVLVGIESHVCVLNTALDLLAAELQVHVCVDAVGSRYAVDHGTALRRMEQAGVVLTTVETVGFEWIGGAQHARFKEFSGLVQERAKSLQA
jgi:nicotinamidase-related amidase